MKQEKTHWFLVEQGILNSGDNQVNITDIKLLHQFNRVLKFKQGEKIVLFDGEGLSVKCEILELQKRACLLKVLERKIKKRDENRLINLFFGVPRKNKFELIIEKGTEVGVTNFKPLITDRTEKLNLNTDRAEKILIEATEQSENSILPLIDEVQPCQDVIQNLNPKNTFVFHTEGEGLHTNDFKFFTEVNLLIGPEGGWSPEEVQTFKEKGFHIYKIGDTVLKTETACIVIPFLFNVN